MVLYSTRSLDSDKKGSQTQHINGVLCSDERGVQGPAQWFSTGVFPILWQQRRTARFPQLGTTHPLHSTEGQRCGKSVPN